MAAGNPTRYGPATWNPRDAKCFVAAVLVMPEQPMAPTAHVGEDRKDAPKGLKHQIIPIFQRRREALILLGEFDTYVPLISAF